MMHRVARHALSSAAKPAARTHAHTQSRLPVSSSSCVASVRSSRARVFCSVPKRATDSAAKLPLSVGLAAGGFAGIVSALTGVGGGIILIPTLAKFTTLTQQAVNGTSIGAVTLAASLGAFNHLQSGACNVPLAAVVTIPSVIFARYGVQTAQRLSSKRLTLVVGTAMLLCAPLIALKKSPYFPKFSGGVDPLDLQLYSSPSQDANALSFADRVRNDIPGFVRVNAKYVVAGCFAGFISGLCGLGGGILMTAYLTAASDMPQEFIIGTSLLSIVPTAASSTYFNIKAKSIHIPTAVRVGGGLGAGVFLTSKYVTHEVPEDVLRTILATTLSTAALVMMRRGL